jgi:hypothetical protein
LVVWWFRPLIDHLQEYEECDLLKIVTRTHSIIEEDIAEAPDLRGYLVFIESHKKKLDVAFHIQEIILYKEIPHESSIMELIDSKDSIDIVTILYLEKTKRNESIFDECYISSDTRSPLVDIHKHLKIRDEYENKKRLFEWILDSIELVEKYIELFRKLKMIIERSICRSPDSHFRDSDFSEILIYEESFSEECMDILEVVLRESDFVFIIDNVLDSIFMIQDHLGFCLSFSVCRVIVLDEDLSIEIAIRIPLEFR